MKEQAQVLNNMSGAGRSSVRVQPRHVEPPPTVATGARVRGNLGVLISLKLLLTNKPKSNNDLWHHIGDDEERFYFFLFQSLKIKSEWTENKEFCEDRLRTLANNTINELGLIGCMILQDSKSLRNKSSQSQRIVALTHPMLTFAILSKSSSQLFVASKTPNLSA